jgi:hypothetical protein
MAAAGSIMFALLPATVVILAIVPHMAGFLPAAKPTYACAVVDAHLGALID